MLSGPGGAAVTGTVAYVAAGSVATFTPTLNLAPSTTFTATITTGAQDQEDPANSLVAKYLWTFTTGAAPDTTIPTVTSTIPANEATAVSVDQVVSPTFSEPMNPATVNATTFTAVSYTHLNKTSPQIFGTRGPARFSTLLIRPRLDDPAVLPRAGFLPRQRRQF